MKKLKIFIVMLLSVCAFIALSCITACKNFDLATPTNIQVDYNHQLTWDEVENARSYTVEIKDSNGEIIDSKKTKQENTSLKSLEVGTYEIRVKAIGSNSGSESDWSEIFEFDRPYETGCVYTLVNNSEYHITGGGSASGNIVIEDFYRNKPVTAIADNAFKGNGRITGIVLGSQIKSIGKNAFYRCENLASVEIPDSVTTIGPQAFYRCISLESVKIPQYLTLIDESTFMSCRALKTVELNENLQYIGEYAFSDCSGLTSLEIPDSVVSVGSYAFAANSMLETVKIGKSVQQIGDFAFQLCVVLTKIEFPQNSALSYIGYRTFYGDTMLTSVDLPSNLTQLGTQAFYKCEKLEAVVMPDSLTSVGSGAFNDTAIYNQQKEAGAKIFYVGKWIVDCDTTLAKTVEAITVEENPDYETLVVKADVIGIAGYVFYNFAELTLVQLPNSLKYMGAYSFAVCPKLIRVEAKGCVIIEDYAFVMCENLTTFDKCENLQEIGGYAFYGCTWLKKFETPSDADTLKSIGMYAFKNTGIWTNASDVVYVGNWIVGAKGDVSELRIDNTTVGIADFAFYENTKLNVANLAGTKLKYIGKGAFYNCTSLTTVQFGVNLKKIEDYTFYGCTRLSMIPNGFPRALQSIGRSAFYGCSSLIEVDLGRTDSFESIGMYAFYNCKSLTTLDLGDSIKVLNNYAFYNCEALQTVTFPDSLQVIGTRAFYKNTALEEIEFGNGLLSIGQYAFAYCSTLKELTLPDSLLYINNSAFYKCSAVESVDFGSGVQWIGSYAFYGLSNVTSLNLTTSVEYVGSYAFKGWNGVTSILLSSTIDAIGEHAFYGCKQATIYTDEKVSETEDGETVYKWNEKFNSSHRPIVWGCTLSEDRTYVTSVTIEENTLANVTAAGGFTAPERDGFVFVGWATEENGEVVYSAEEIANVSVGTTLYSVWEEASVEDNDETIAA